MLAVLTLTSAVDRQQKRVELTRQAAQHARGQLGQDLVNERRVVLLQRYENQDGTQLEKAPGRAAAKRLNIGNQYLGAQGTDYPKMTRGSGLFASMTLGDVTVYGVLTNQHVLPNASACHRTRVTFRGENADGVVQEVSSTLKAHVGEGTNPLYLTGERCGSRVPTGAPEEIDMLALGDGADPANRFYRVGDDWAFGSLGVDESHELLRRLRDIGVTPYQLDELIDETRNIPADALLNVWHYGSGTHGGHVNAFNDAHMEGNVKKTNIRWHSVENISDAFHAMTSFFASGQGCLLPTAQEATKQVPVVITVPVPGPFGPIPYPMPMVATAEAIQNRAIQMYATWADACEREQMPSWSADGLPEMIFGNDASALTRGSSGAPAFIDGRFVGIEVSGAGHMAGNLMARADHIVRMMEFSMGSHTLDDAFWRSPADIGLDQEWNQYMRNLPDGALQG